MPMIFNLPDLGEGLPDAEIREWHVQVGDMVKMDAPLVSMETAKAVVEVPSPQDGVITKCYGEVGDLIQTGHPLVAFEGEQTIDKPDQGTVVGELKTLNQALPDNFMQSTIKERPRMTPATRLLAKKYGILPESLKGTGKNGLITREDVENARGSLSTEQNHVFHAPFVPLHGVRRVMATTMSTSHREVVPVSIFDEADIQAWSLDEDITVRLIFAIKDAIEKEPGLNAWFDGKKLATCQCEALHLGLAVDTDDGLFVPVISNAERQKASELRKTINEYRQAVMARTISPELLKDATFILSNFGKFSGRFASPIVVPPMVAILAVGKIYERPVVQAGHMEPHRLLPLSLSFDHRAVTGGEASRFLGALIASLELSVYKQHL